MRKNTTFILGIVLTGMLAGLLPHAYPKPKKEINPASTIDRVMVYHDRALVARVAHCGDLEPGIYDIMFNNMSALLSDESVRAKTAGTDVKILDVEVKSMHLEQSPEKLVQEHQNVLQELQDEKKSIENIISILKNNSDYLNGVSQSFLGVPSLQGAKNGNRRLGMQYRDRLSIQDYDKMRLYLDDRFRENAASILREEKKLRTIEKKITVAKEKLSTIQGPADGLSKKKFIKVTVEVLKRGAFTMEISYINQKISWKPGYDIRVFVDEKKTEFIGYGIVEQKSGEDWLNAQISYSTAQPAIRGNVPELIPVYATLASKLTRKSGGKQSKAYVNQQQLNKLILDNVEQQAVFGKADDGIVIDSASERSAKRQVGSLVFTTPKRATIPSDGSAHRTVISRQTLPVKFEYICTPKISPHAYLQAVGVNNLTTPILRGDLNIFMGYDFVGSSYTDNILPGEDFELGLSVNENIRVTRSLEEKEEKEGGLFSGKKSNYRFLIKIENYSGNSIVMNIFDQIPVSRSSEIEIKNVSFSHNPQVKDVKGICKWQFSMKPKETVNLNFSFTVAMPKDQDAAFFRTKLSPGMYLEQLSTGGVSEQFNDNEYNIKQENAPALRMKMK